MNIFVRLFWTIRLFVGKYNCTMYISFTVLNLTVFSQTLRTVGLGESKTRVSLVESSLKPVVMPIVRISSFMQSIHLGRADRFRIEVFNLVVVRLFSFCAAANYNVNYISVFLSAFSRHLKILIINNNQHTLLLK